MPAQIGYFDTLKSVAGKVFTYLASITLTGTDGKTITVTQNTSLDEAVAMSSKATEEAWTDYSAISTVVGWAATPTVAIFYKKMGRSVYVYFEISGTSNATNITFTVPNNSKRRQVFAGAFTQDNTVVESAGHGISSAGSKTITWYRWNETNWTASGTKAASGSFWYECE